MGLLTKEQKQMYIASGGVRCPFCGSENIEGHSGEFGANASQEISCHNCHARWLDSYTLTDVMESELPRNEKRAAYAEVALRAHQQSKCEEFELSEESITDLITDLLHLAQDKGKFIDGVLSVAKHHFEEEQKGA